MPARSIGTATISFGLVSVPVNLYSSAESKAERVVQHAAQEVRHAAQAAVHLPEGQRESSSRDDTVKGYEFAKDQYVVLTPRSSRRSRRRRPARSTSSSSCRSRRSTASIVEKVYYLGPDKGGDRAYRLLAAALDETGRAALGQYAARGQQYLVLLRPLNGVLVMEQLHYADEVRPTTEVTVPTGDVKPTELALAKQLIEQIGERRRSSRRSTRTRCASACSRRFSKKVDGQDITAEEAPAEPAARSSTSWKRSRRASHAAAAREGQHKSAGKAS